MGRYYLLSVNLDLILLEKLVHSSPSRPYPLHLLHSLNPQYRVLAHNSCSSQYGVIAAVHVHRLWHCNWHHRTRAWWLLAITCSIHYHMRVWV